ncbi:putative Phosphatidylinositol-4-phosphate 5-kinase [Aduncisulcus paluster]|uniref:Phosphatidylinositol-4-phosphate 5-kinase n=1 Tax=Aduncisulcus paluster TaxID=2918883 RepID=A0ABQ5KYN7_9EUKA|nr:putative Phosphatidylinositol-4-phosphate 5-kinase [Aduncisulcus paluster]
MSEEEEQAQLIEVPDIGTYTGGRNKLGERHGTGKMVFANKDVYEGEYQDGKRTGKGKYKWFASGCEYEGDYVDGLRDGEGTMKYNNGAVYGGTWVKGKRHGAGKMIFPNKDFYYGEWKEGLQSGTGMYTYKQSRVSFHGIWELGRFIEGEIRYPDGGIYKGSFRMNQPWGEGTFKFGDLEQKGEFIELHPPKEKTEEDEEEEEEEEEEDEDGEKKPKREKTPLEMLEKLRRMKLQWIPDHKLSGRSGDNCALPRRKIISLPNPYSLYRRDFGECDCNADKQYLLSVRGEKNDKIKITSLKYDPKTSNCSILRSFDHSMNLEDIVYLNQESDEHIFHRVNLFDDECLNDTYDTSSLSHHRVLAMGRLGEVEVISLQYRYSNEYCDETKDYSVEEEYDYLDIPSVSGDVSFSGSLGCVMLNGRPHHGILRERGITCVHDGAFSVSREKNDGNSTFSHECQLSYLGCMSDGLRCSESYNIPETDLSRGKARLFHSYQGSMQCCWCFSPLMVSSSPLTEGMSISDTFHGSCGAFLIDPRCDKTHLFPHCLLPCVSVDDIVPIKFPCQSAPLMGVISGGYLRIFDERNMRYPVSCVRCLSHVKGCNVNPHNSNDVQTEYIGDCGLNEYSPKDDSLNGFLYLSLWNDHKTELIELSSKCLDKYGDDAFITPCGPVSSQQIDELVPLSEDELHDIHEVTVRKSERDSILHRRHYGGVHFNLQQPHVSSCQSTASGIEDVHPIMIQQNSGRGIVSGGACTISLGALGIDIFHLSSYNGIVSQKWIRKEYSHTNESLISPKLMVSKQLYSQRKVVERHRNVDRYVFQQNLINTASDWKGPRGNRGSTVALSREFVPLLPFIFNQETMGNISSQHPMWISSLNSILSSIPHIPLPLLPLSSFPPFPLASQHPLSLVFRESVRLSMFGYSCERDRLKKKRARKAQAKSLGGEGNDLNGEVIGDGKRKRVKKSEKIGQEREKEREKEKHLIDNFYAQTAHDGLKTSFVLGMGAKQIFKPTVANLLVKNLKLKKASKHTSYSYEFYGDACDSDFDLKTTFNQLAEYNITFSKKKSKVPRKEKRKNILSIIFMHKLLMMDSKHPLSLEWGQNKYLSPRIQYYIFKKEIKGSEEREEERGRSTDEKFFKKDGFREKEREKEKHLIDNFYAQTAHDGLKTSFVLGMGAKQIFKPTVANLLVKNLKLKKASKHTSYSYEFYGDACDSDFDLKTTFNQLAEYNITFSKKKSKVPRKEKRKEEEEKHLIDNFYAQTAHDGLKTSFVLGMGAKQIFKPTVANLLVKNLKLKKASKHTSYSYEFYGDACDSDFDLKTTFNQLAEYNITFSKKKSKVPRKEKRKRVKKSEKIGQEREKEREKEKHLIDNFYAQTAHDGLKTSFVLGMGAKQIFKPTVANLLVKNLKLKKASKHTSYSYEFYGDACDSDFDLKTTFNQLAEYNITFSKKKSKVPRKEKRKEEEVLMKNFLRKMDSVIGAFCGSSSPIISSDDSLLSASSKSTGYLPQMPSCCIPQKLFHTSELDDKLESFSSFLSAEPVPLLTQIALIKQQNVIIRMIGSKQKEKGGEKKKIENLELKSQEYL